MHLLESSVLVMQSFIFLFFINVIENLYPLSPKKVWQVKPQVHACIKHEANQGYLLWIGSGPLGILLLLLRYASSPACPPPEYRTGELVVVVLLLARPAMLGPELITPTPLVVDTITTRSRAHTTKMTTTAILQHANAPTDLSGRLPI